MADELTPELVSAVEQACAPVQVGTTNVLYFTFEALHELSVQLGDLYHDEFAPMVEKLEALESDGDMRELLGEFNAHIRMRFENWIAEHERPFIVWWCVHSLGGMVLRWRIDAAK